MRLLGSNGHGVPTAQSLGMNQLWLSLCPCNVHAWGTQASAIPVASACWFLHKRPCRGQKRLNILTDPSGWPRLPLPLYPLAWIEAPMLSMGRPQVLECNRRSQPLLGESEREGHKFWPSLGYIVADQLGPNSEDCLG